MVLVVVEDIEGVFFRMDLGCFVVAIEVIVVVGLLIQNWGNLSGHIGSVLVESCILW